MMVNKNGVRRSDRAPPSSRRRYTRDLRARPPPATAAHVPGNPGFTLDTLLREVRATQLSGRCRQRIVERMRR